MPFDATCSGCGASYSLRDEMQGKKVRCKKCQQTFVAEPAAAGGNAFDFTNGPSDEAMQDEKRPVKSAAKRRPVEEDEPERPRRRRTDDDEDQPKRPAKKKSSAGLILGIIGGIAAVLLLVCCGGPIGAYYLWIKPAAEQAKERADRLQQQLDEDMRKIQNGGPPGGNPGGIIIPGDNVNRRPNNLNEALEALRSNDVNRQREAADWLCFQRTDPARKDEVGKALEPLLTDRRDGRLRINAAKAMSFGWVSKDNKAVLIRELQVPNGSPTEEQKLMMQALGALQDAQTAGVLARWLPQTEEARIALTKIGTPAEPEVLKYFNHNNPQARARARQLIQNWNSPRGPTCLQCAQDAKSLSKDIDRRAALSYLQTAPRDQAVAAQVAASLESAAADPDWTLAIEAVRALDVWGSKDNTPGLAKVAEANVNVNNGFQLWKATVGVLGKWKDDRAVPAVALGLGKGESQAHRNEAVRALIAIGSPAVKQEVEAKYLNHTNPEVRKSAAQVLAGLGGGTVGGGDNVGLAKSLADLKSPQLGSRHAALRWFLANKPPAEAEKRKEAAKALAALLNDPDQRSREESAKALGAWGDKDNVKALIALLTHPDRGTRNAAMDGLAGIKDEQSAMVLVQKLIGEDRGHAVVALKAFGPKAETAVLSVLLPVRDKGLAIEACRILQAIGTRKSVPALNTVIVAANTGKPRHPDLAKAAALAIQAIAARP